jgi:glycosyltransferase involved in cell wall biosynthesis
MPTVSIVIRALNEAAHLPALFAGIARGTRQPDQLVLVDSGSMDDTVAIALAHGAEVVRIDPERFSFGRALNLGCRHASGEVLVFVSAHVYPLDEHWLERLVEPFDGDAALSYGRQIGDHRTQFSEWEIMRRWFPAGSDQDQRHPFCNNANCAIRRSIWEELPYDESLTGLEDLDWATRALAAGQRLVYQADAEVAHVHEETFRQTINRYRREAMAHQQMASGVRLGAVEACWLFGVNVLRDYLAALARHRFFRNIVPIARFRFAQFWGSWRGSTGRGDIDPDLKRRFYYPRGFPGLASSALTESGGVASSPASGDGEP